MTKLYKYTAVALFGVFLPAYILLLAYALLFKHVSPLELFNPNRFYYPSWNLVPFRTINSYLRSLSVIPLIALSNLLGNVLLFIPFGIYLRLFKWKMWTCLLAILLAPPCIEGIQFALKIGAADVDDWILNCLGGILGLFGCKILSALLKNEDRLRLVVVMGGFAAVLVPLAATILGSFRFRLG